MLTGKAERSVVLPIDLHALGCFVLQTVVKIIFNLQKVLVVYIPFKGILNVQTAAKNGKAKRKHYCAKKYDSNDFQNFHVFFLQKIRAPRHIQNHVYGSGLYFVIIFSFPQFEEE